MLVKPRINSERSRCLQVAYLASLVVPRWFSVSPT